jgi:hypothetical protein
MTKFKIIASVATLAASLIASAAMADCSDSQFRQVGKLATIAVSEQIATDAPVQSKKTIKITQCQATDGLIKAEFIYSYLGKKGLSTVSGSVEVENGLVVALNVSDDAPSFASNDDETVNFGPVKLN